MSRKGMPYDNAVMESFFASLKQELTHHEQFKDRDEARTRVFDYIEVFDKPRAIAQRAGQPLTRRLRRAGATSPRFE
jgi:putative transposase